MPVLYGVFLYMGVSALRGLQFFDRIKLLFMPMKNQPDTYYIRHVPINVIHKFTAIQILCLVLLWLIQFFKSISAVFPLMVRFLSFKFQFVLISMLLLAWILWTLVAKFCLLLKKKR